MRSRKFIGIVAILALLMDLYVFQAVKAVSQGVSADLRLIIYGVFWGVSVLAGVIFLLLPLVVSAKWRSAKSYAFFTIIAFFFANVLAAVFLLADDIRRAVQWVSGSDHPIERSILLSWLGLGVGSGLVIALVYGFSNKYRYKVQRVRLAYENLPAGFRGLKIVQLSDIHSGSLADRDAVARGVEQVLAERPDLVLFTGDLVNDASRELDGLKEVLGRLRAPLGVFSVLGNHDYGDYIWWETPALKKANLDRLKQMQAEMGWRLLMNEHVVLERGGGQIALIGIENWSAKARFPKHGKLKEAHAGAEKYPFKILMSHDPSHWDAEVRPNFPDIDLALAGHTHGMQFGIDLPGLKWSPVKYVYRQWAGLYEEGRQKLYVNRGFGFIGYPGRVGILPEITVIELV